MTETKKSEWNSNIAFVMAMIGSAVGLGNIWRFPNVLYSNGGGSFMIPYIISLFLLGISFVLVEYAVGFKFKKSLAQILYFIKEKLEPVAWFVLLIVFLITTYYVCVVGDGHGGDVRTLQSHPTLPRRTVPAVEHLGRPGEGAVVDGHGDPRAAVCCDDVIHMEEA